MPDLYGSADAGTPSAPCSHPQHANHRPYRPALHLHWLQSTLLHLQQAVKAVVNALQWLRCAVRAAPCRTLVGATLRVSPAADDSSNLNITILAADPLEDREKSVCRTDSSTNTPPDQPPSRRTMLLGLPRSPHNIALLLFEAAVLFILPVGANILGSAFEFEERTPTILPRGSVIVNNVPVVFTKPAPLDLKLQNNNRSLIPAQICGIVGAYFLTIVVIGICLLTFGRRMRREAQYGSGLLEVEMVKPTQKIHDPSPMSPASTTRSWMKSAFGRGRKGSMTSASNISAPVSPGIGAGHESFDTKIMQENRQREMELLYQAVMEHDAKKASTTDVTAVDPEEEEEEPPMSPASPHPQQEQFQSVEDSSPNKPKDKRLLRIQTERGQDVPRDLASPLSPNSPGNLNSPVRAIYPPDSPIPDGPQSPRSPIRAGSHASQSYPRPPPYAQGLPASPRSILSNGNRSSRGSITSGQTAVTNKSGRKTLRNLRISSPGQKGEEDDEERQPLSPGIQSPGAQTPHTGKSFNSVTTTHTMITEDDEDEEYERRRYEAYESLDKVQPLPRPAPQRASSHPSNQELHTQASNKSLKSAGSSTATLPLRNPAYQIDVNVPPTPVKTTYLETRKMGGARGPLTAGLTPMTGVPMTPYSPYMPFTPITPVTPHLINKRERKMRLKDDRRRVMARDEGDLVQSPKEIWGDDY
ncbi:hypothetical protein NA57DRAFT_50694 [Rhizodiscina lignyota]|uniref:Uncharacterized protein n=1 Tax=Rhizodiscina lignyota TaxID=1504668 RepID=A0A9P4MDV2_9PEZI|nr:hypothetical protein NA57DRAFT_50694 [Rhizodiscina lignyota]